MKKILDVCDGILEYVTLIISSPYWLTRWFIEFRREFGKILNGEARLAWYQLTEEERSIWANKTIDAILNFRRV